MGQAREAVVRRLRKRLNMVWRWNSRLRWENENLSRENKGLWKHVARLSRRLTASGNQIALLTDQVAQQAAQIAQQAAQIALLTGLNPGELTGDPIFQRVSGIGGMKLIPETRR